MPSPASTTLPRVVLVSYRLVQQNSEFGGSLGTSQPLQTELYVPVTPQLGQINRVLTSAANVCHKNGMEILLVGALSGAFSETEQDEMRSRLKEQENAVPIFIEEETSKTFFFDFCKRILWPLFHYYGNLGAHFTRDGWEAYQKVNQMFAETIAKEYKEGDLIFIQDYHLMLVPALLRKLVPNAKISFFLHIPWPTSELYRSLPVRKEILEGILGADVVGFQTFPYARHFLSSCSRGLGLRITPSGVEFKESFIRVEVNPVGIDPKIYFDALDTEEATTMIENLEQKYQGMKIIVSRDSHEHVKGIPQKLKCFAKFLEKYPQWVGKVVLFQECKSDSETGPQGVELANEIERLVGSINGKYGNVTYMPINYLIRSLSWNETCALFAVGDAALITPLRDGMNIPSHEFIACQRKKMAPLILSEFAGAASCLSGAFLVNPYHEDKVAETLNEILLGNREDFKMRFKQNFQYVTTHDSKFWFMRFMQELQEKKQPSLLTPAPPLPLPDIISSFKSAKKRLLLLDYDGTLTPIVSSPSAATPSPELLKALTTLSANPQNRVYVITGRDRTTIEKWLGSTSIGLSAEHGAFFRKIQTNPNEKPKWDNFLDPNIDLSWREGVKQLLNDYTERTPNSFVEEKEVNITWHYRNSDPDFGEMQKNALLFHLQTVCSKSPVDILVGKKNLEIRPAGIHKGYVVKKIMEMEKDIDFVLCMGDDATDEDMFNELCQPHPSRTGKMWSVLVEGKDRNTKAMFHIENQHDVVPLLEALASN